MNRPPRNHTRPLNRKNDRPKFAHRSLNLVEAGKALVNEGVFIGIVPSTLQGEYTSLASFSHLNYSMVKEILRKQKAELVRQFDLLQRLGQLDNLRQTDFERFAKLYRAKYLQNPKPNGQSS